MDKLFKYYALDGSGLQGAHKRPIDHVYDSAEAAFKVSTYCLESAVPGTFTGQAFHRHSEVPLFQYQVPQLRGHAGKNYARKR